MSLSSALKNKNSFARRFIDERFPDLQILSHRSLERELKAQPFPHDGPYGPNYPYDIAGTAIDYRIRAYFSDGFYKSPAILGGIEQIESCCDSRTGDILTGNRWSEFFRIENNAPSISEQLLEALKILAERTGAQRRAIEDADEARLSRFCLILAHVDWCYREKGDDQKRFMRSIGNADIDLMLSMLDDSVIEDTKRISKAFYTHNQELISRFKNALVGRQFRGSVDIGGADCDLIVDQSLIDIKAIKLLPLDRVDLPSVPQVPPGFRVSRILANSSRRRWTPVTKVGDALRQLVGYLLLDYDDEYEINSVEIWLVRQNCRLHFDVNSQLVPSKNKLQDLRAEFKAGLVNERAAQEKARMAPANRGAARRSPRPS